MKEWLELLRRLGDAILELAAAEVDALSQDLRHGGREAARAVLQLAIAFVLLALAWGLLTLALVWGLARVIGDWQAALLVGAVYVLAGAGFGIAGVRRWRAFEPPLAVVKRRVRDQGEWLRQSLLALPEADAEEIDEP